MGARLYINSVLLLTFINQHQRHILRFASILRAHPGLLRSSANELRVELDPSIPVLGLFSQCSGGWDWAPYSNTAQPDGTPTFTSGLWKDVYLAFVPWLAITAITPLITYTGDFPIERLIDGHHAPFLLNVTTHVSALHPIDVTVLLDTEWGGRLRTSRRLPAGSTSFSLTLEVASSQIHLWWPAGLGSSPLYFFNLTFAGAPGRVSISRRVGFRFFALVTGNDTDAEYRRINSIANGSDLLTARFRINGLSFFARGANVVPMDELEGRWTADAHRLLVASARAAGMNLLRIWGGGVFLPSAFYEACDTEGILLYHDLMHRGALVNDSSVLDAFGYQVRRLSHHPSIVIWNGCNECDPGEGGIAISLMSAIVREDGSRVVWPASPAQGWLSGVHRLSGLPNGEPLIPRTSSDLNSTITAFFSPDSFSRAQPGTQQCTFLADHDVDGPAVSASAASREDCCILCWSWTECRGAVYHGGTCWLKQSGFIYSRSDTSPSTCLLTNSTRKPLRYAIESHGPYQFGNG